MSAALAVNDPDHVFTDHGYESDTNILGNLASAELRPCS